MNQNSAIVNGKLTSLSQTYQYSYCRTKIQGKDYFLDVSSEGLLEAYINSLLIHVSPDSKYYLLSNQYVINNNKRPDWSTDLNKCADKISKSQKDWVSTKKKLTPYIVELKRNQINQKVLLETLFVATANQYVTKNFEGSKSKDKLYANNYIKTATSLNLTITRIKMIFVAPIVSDGAREWAHHFNELKSLVRVELRTIEEFINEIIEDIPSDKWFLLQSNPCIAKSTKIVNEMIEQQKAVLIND